MRAFLLSLIFIPSLALAAPTSELADSATSQLLQTVEVVSTPKERGELSKQPLSSTSLGALRDHQVKDLKTASTLVPNLFIPDYGSRLTSAIYIRGVGSRTGTPAVAMYVDNIPYADKSAFDFNFFDIERVDVLRGPQTTLYGRGAMGGIIKVHTKNPFRYQGTDVHLGYNTGNDRRTASLTHYHRVSNKLAFSGGAYAEGASGFWTNTTTARRADRLHSLGSRLRAIVLPTDALKMDLSVSYDHSRQSGYPYFYMGAVPGNEEQYADLKHQISNNHESTYRRSLLNAGANIEYQGQGWTLNSITGYQHMRDRMFLDQDFLRADIYTLTQKQRLHNFSEELIFRSRRAGKWQWLSGASLMAQTLRTKGPVTFYSDGLRWLESNINSNMPSIDRIPTLKAMGFEGMSVNFRGDQLEMAGTYSTPTISAALFHESTFQFTPQLTLTAGLRLNYENQRMRYNSPAHVDYGFSMPNSASQAMAVDLQDLSTDILYKGTLRRNYLHLLPKLALQYDFDHRNNVYASVTMGQRSGGYNLQMFSDLLQGAMRGDMMDGIQEGVVAYIDELAKNNPRMPQQMGGKPMSQFVGDMMAENMPKTLRPTTDQVVYKPEYSWNYELGAHLRPTDRFSLDAALFLSTIHDQQISRFAPSGLGRMMVNAGKSRSWGGELALSYRPTDRIALSGSYGYTHATFQRYDDGTGTNYDGNYVPFAPQHTVFAEAAYTIPLSGERMRSISLAVNMGGNGRIYWTEDNQYYQNFQGQLGARASFHLPWGIVSVWGKNLTDNKYHTFYFLSARRMYAQYGAPRHVGVDVSIKL